MSNELDIKELREDLGESQQVFADRFAVTQSTVSLWEKNGAPTRGVVRKYLDQLRRETGKPEQQEHQTTEPEPAE